MVEKSNHKDIIKELKKQVADLKRKEKAVRKELRVALGNVGKAIRAGEKKVAQKVKEAKAQMESLKASFVKKYEKPVKKPAKKARKVKK